VEVKSGSLYVLPQRELVGIPYVDRSYVETRIAWNRVNNPSQLEELTRTDLLWP
jgi:hypothetical protein